MEENQHLCETCRKPTIKHCDKCKTTYYCSPKCQKVMYPIHEFICGKDVATTTVLAADVELYRNKQNVAFRDIFKYNLFQEWDALVNMARSGRETPYAKARRIIYDAIISMARMDPVYGDIPLEPTEEHITIVAKSKADMRDAGRILYEIGGDDELRDPLLWSVIPWRFIRIVDFAFDGIGTWMA